jgi:hypothetical protein
LAAGCGLDDAAGFAVFAVSASDKTISALAARGFFRSGFICLATLSHKARSSSLRLRFRRGETGNSGIKGEDGRFIGRRGNGDIGGGGAARGSA